VSVEYGWEAPRPPLELLGTASLPAYTSTTGCVARHPAVRPKGMSRPLEAAPSGLLAGRAHAGVAEGEGEGEGVPSEGARVLRSCEPSVSSSP
jgi:hypothetical protein